MIIYALRKREGEKDPGMKFMSRITPRFSLEEIDRINENSLSIDVDMNMCRKKRKNLSNTAINVENENTPMEDLISSIPDDALCSILSHLSMRDIVRTSILSRRWRHLWKISLKKLDFDDTNSFMSRSGITELKRLDQNVAFVRWVNQVLGVHCGTMEFFKMKRYLPLKYSHEFENWIQLAADKNVRELNISFSKKYDNLESWKLHSFPYWIFADHDAAVRLSLNHLSLSACKLSLPSRFSGFSSLTSLVLNDTCVTQKNLMNILSNCLSLEWLSIFECHTPSCLKFTSGSRSCSLKLKHLNISFCNILEEIDIRDITKSLVSFELMGNMLGKLLCTKSSTVKRLYSSNGWNLSEDYDLNSLASDFPQLETLLLSYSLHFQENQIPTILPTFTNLKHLVLMLTERHPSILLEFTSTFLKASPLLQKLEIHLPFPIHPYEEKEELESSPESCWPHQNNLREVEIHNFQGDGKAVELVVNLVNSCPYIRKVQIDRKCLSYEGDGGWLIFGFPTGIKRKQVLKMLQRRISADANLMVL